MPPARRQPQKGERLPFNPPSRASTAAAGSSKQSAPSKSRPKGKETSENSTKSKAPSSKTAPKSRRKQHQSKNSDYASESASEPESTGNRSQENSVQSDEPDYMLAEIITRDKSDDVMSSEPTIPPKLLTKLLHHNFQNPKTKISKDANEAVAKYVDIFVRESLARSVYERSEAEGGSDGQISLGDGFLEVCVSPLPLGSVGFELRIDFFFFFFENRSRISRKWHLNWS